MTLPQGAEHFVSELVKVMGTHGMDVSPDARRPPILMADSVAANNQRVDDATYARNALTAARDAARLVFSPASQALSSSRRRLILFFLVLS